MKNFKSVLLLKIPYCQYPDRIKEDNNFRTKAPFRPVPTLTLPSLCAFVDKYKTCDYRLKAIDINIEAYTNPGANIDISLYGDLMANCIKQNNYDVLALSAMFVFNVPWVDMAVRLSRKHHPKAKIILGGGYATLFPERCLHKHEIDDVVIGEGEAAFLHILNRYNNHRDADFERRFSFNGHAFKNEKGDVVIVPRKQNFLHSEDLLVPAWNYLDIKKYFRDSGDGILPIEASRGCPYNCTYCCTYLSWGKRVRYKSVESLVKEIRQITNTYNLSGFHFVDDNLSFSRKWFVQFLLEFIEMRLPVTLDFSNFSVKHLDQELIDLLMKAGMKRISIAIESGSADIQKQINKNVNLDQAREIVKIIKSKGLQVHVCWMLGFPGETLKQINTTFEFARELKAHSNQFLTVLPYPGTKLFETAKRDGFLVFQEDELDKFDYRKCDYLKSTEWNYEQLQEMIYDINIDLNFLNNAFFDIPGGEEKMLRFMEKLLLRLPDHVIGNVIVGYIYKNKNKITEAEKYYRLAAELLQERPLNNVFYKYFSWDHPIINDFNRYVDRTGSGILKKELK